MTLCDPKHAKLLLPRLLQTRPPTWSPRLMLFQGEWVCSKMKDYLYQHNWKINHSGTFQLAGHLQFRWWWKDSVWSLLSCTIQQVLPISSYPYPHKLFKRKKWTTNTFPQSVCWNAEVAEVRWLSLTFRRHKIFQFESEKCDCRGLEGMKKILILYKQRGTRAAYDIYE